MADSAVGFLVNKLNNLVMEEVMLLSGVLDEVEELKEELESMRSFLKDAEMRKEREEGVKTWVKQVRSAAYQVEDILDDFVLRVAGQQHGVAFLRRLLCCFKGLSARHVVATRIQTVRRRITRISQRKDMYNLRSSEEGESAFGPPAPSDMVTLNQMDVVGMEGTRNTLMKELTDEDEGLKLITLHGKPGLGKSTLVSLVFESPEVEERFDRRTWATVSQFRSIKELMKTLLKGLFDAWDEMVLKQMEKMDVKPLRTMLKKYLSNKRYLIVLQDMSDVQFWEQIKGHLPNEGRGSRIIVTTRSSDMVDSLESTGMKCCRLEIEPLEESSSMQLFCRKAFPNQPQELEGCPPDAQLEEVCRRMVNRCRGWPLAIIALGMAMSKKERTKEAWERVEQTMSANPSLDSVRSIFSLVYRELPMHLRPCFMYCSIFPEDYLFKRNRLISMWVAEGLIEGRRGMNLEEVGEEYLKELVRWGVFEVVEANKRERVKTFRINTLLQSVVLSISEEEDFGSLLNEHHTEGHEKVRRLTIHRADEAAIRSCLRMRRLRSLLFFGMDSIRSTTLKNMFASFRSLRVLDLQDAPITGLPKSLVDLFYLRYLNLRRTRVKRLPSSFHRLANLQTLDVRETEIRTMASGLSKLENMCHLLMCPYVQFFPMTIDRIQGIKVPRPLCNLQKLQSLTGVNANGRIVKEIGSLTQLKKLEIFRVRWKHGKTLCKSLGNLKRLSRLSIVAVSEDEPLQLEAADADAFKPPPLIKSLQLAGRLDGLPEWISRLRSLAHLGLFASQLTKQPFSNFSPEKCCFPNLTSLTLYEAYVGQDLEFKEGLFPKLKELRLVKLTALVILVMEVGSAPCLERLEIEGCSSLVMVPQHMEGFSNLKEFELWNVHRYLINNIKREVDQGRFGENRKLSITHQYSVDGEWCTETLL
ncbi:disease resistance protein RPM1-like [Nymphaea colorata]|uniref:NB-ARC domain-containing protein n=1 Tax=Nymphaea colorata TaxID=210225 RepID=A0A5K1GXB4_9MAGN|nr:disease resistance protein RPM1-like [Nymphaea colorata]